VGSQFANLDAELPGGGWPRGALIECLPSAPAIGEISLLLPALRTLESSARLAFVAPPANAHAPAWAAYFASPRILQIDAQGEDIAWSAELLLASGGLGALLVWLPARISNKALRRLQLAAEGRRSLAFIFRSPQAAASPSPAPLRLALSAAQAGLQVQILKRRGPPCANPVHLTIDRPLPWDRARARLDPPRNTRPTQGIPLRTPQLGVIGQRSSA
jgi:protein ImuA